MSKQTVIVTGSNRGIGYEALKLLGSKKFDLIMTYRTEKSAKEAEEKLKKEGIELKDKFQLDLTSDDSVNKFVKDVKGKYKTIDFLVNNAGIMARGNNPFAEDVTVENAKKLFRVNTWATIDITEKLMDIVKEGIICVSSTLGQLATNMAPLSKENREKYEKAEGLDGLKKITELIYEAIDKNELGKRGYPVINKNTYMFWPIYSLSKFTLNWWIRKTVAAKKNKVPIIPICPGWCKTNLGTDNAPRTATQGAQVIEYLVKGGYKNHNGHFVADKGTKEFKSQDW